MESCLFCRIVAGEVPAKKLYEDERCVAFFDIHPMAPIHYLVIPKMHIGCVDEICAENADVVGDLFVVIAKLSKQVGLENGYRVITNCGADADQTVPHLHFHVLGGTKLPPKLG